MPSNRERSLQPAQTWDPVRYARYAGFVAELGEPVLRLLDPKPGERILDLGCGDGALTLRIAGTGARAVGIDSSAEQVAATRARGLDARVMDAANLAFSDEFDAVFSNAALHWMLPPEAAIAGVHRALARGGRFVAEFGCVGNVAVIVRAIFDALDRRGIDGVSRFPWYYPGTDDYRRRLEDGGFDVDSMALIPRPTPLAAGIAAWLDTFCASFTRGMPETGRREFVAEVEAALAPYLRDADGTWNADYVRLRFAARKRGGR